MASRKAAKQTDAEMIEKATDAGDVSPPKRRKVATKTANKTEEKQPKLPRAAKSVKTDETNVTESNSTVTKNAKAKGKTMPAKSAASPTRANSKAKSATKKGKDSEEKSGSNLADAEDAKNNDEIQMKKTRTKASAKKAGMDVDEETKGKPKGRGKKNAVPDDTEQPEVPSPKRSRNMKNIESAPKENKSKAKTTKKKGSAQVKEIKSKASNVKGKASSTNDTENDTEEALPANEKQSKKINNDKVAKAPMKRTRGRKNEPVADNIPEDEQELDVQTSDIDKEVQDKELDVPEVSQIPKKGRNTKKKEENEPQIKATRTRGKAVKDVQAANEDNVNTVETTKATKKKAAAPRKGRGKKASPTDEDIDEKADSENSVTEDKKTLNVTQILLGNNNIQKSSEDEQMDADEDVKHTKSSQNADPATTAVIKTEEDNGLDTSVEEEEENLR